MYAFVVGVVLPGRAALATGVADVGDLCKVTGHSLTRTVVCSHLSWPL